MRIAIVGGGVIGLSTAYCLLFGTPSDQDDSGIDLKIDSVTIFSPQPASETTSASAAAFWSPYWIGDYDRVHATRTWDELKVLHQRDTPGISRLIFDEYMTQDAAEAFESDKDISHWWRTLDGMDFESSVLDPPRVVSVEGQPAKLTMRHRYQTYVARMPDYLAHLEQSIERSAKVHWRCQWVDSLQPIADQFDAVFHCTGWGARELVRDDPMTTSMRLLAGHAVLVDAPDIRNAQLFFGEPFVGRSVYIVPRLGSLNDVLCGGTAVDVTESAPSIRQAMNFDRQVVCDEVIYRVRGVEPGLADRPEVGRAVGVRPVREAVRCEPDGRLRNVFHGYGHGGSGLTLSWGTAEALCKMVGQTTDAGISS